VTGPFGWGLALLASAVVAWIAYPAGSRQTLRPVLALLRLLSAAAVLALVLDLPVGVARAPDALVALDASASWLRSGDSAAWRAAMDTARAAGASGSVLLFGDSVRSATMPFLSADAASRVAPVVQRAASAGQRVVIVTDGAIDDADALQRVVAGSRVVVVPVTPAADRAVSDVNTPSEGRVGDTITLQARVVADAAMPRASSLRWTLDQALLGEVVVPSLTAGGEAVVESRVVIPAGDSVALLRAVLEGGGDAFPGNDSVSIVFRRDVRQRVVIVSTAPDADIRDVATALRANIAMPTDAYYRIAPGRWLREGGLTPVEESVVRAAVRGASLAVLHGDTMAVGAPSSLGTRALLLLSPPTTGAADLVVRTPPSSPLQAGLAGIVVESLPPLLVSSPARGGVIALSAAPGMPTTSATPIVAVIEGDVRRVLITAAGYSRWRSRGGVSEVAFQSLIGGATDWLLGARGRAPAPAPLATLVRAGSEIRWRRGAQPRSLVVLTRDGDRAPRRDSLIFGTAAEATMPSLGAGVWRGTADGTAIVIPVSASRELLPRLVTMRSSALNGVAVAVRRGARSLGWLYLASVLLLAAEWLLRRRAGLR
jgi:hypothetical protein